MTTLTPYTRFPDSEHTRSYLGARFIYLADSADTGGAYSVIDAAARPGQEPPPHVHSFEDEALYILDGQWTFYCGEAATQASPGAFVFLPRGIPHHFRLHDDVGRALVIISPGGLEAAFKELSGPAPAGVDLPTPLAGPPPIDRILEAFSPRGVQFLPPPT